MIAEDLGPIDDEVLSLRKKFKLPGMRILQFDLNENSYPDEFDKNSVVYTGTHDNDTLIGWLDTLKDKNAILNNFLSVENKNNWKVIEFALNSAANSVIIPLQDILGLGYAARFNTPGTISDKNWSWRFNEGQLTNKLKTKMKNLTLTSCRNFIN